MMSRAQARWLGLQPYSPVWERMRRYTDERDADSPDQFWCLEHEPVYTLGRAADPAHILISNGIPVVRSDRGGQVTYHGPGQLVIYPLLDLQRLGIGTRSLVERIEGAISDYCAGFGIDARGRRDAPGVYVGDRKIASLGLRVVRQRTLHGLSFNVNMDLVPFSAINPCGYQGLQMTQLAQEGGPDSVHEVCQPLLNALCERLGIPVVQMQDDADRDG